MLTRAWETSVAKALSGVDDIGRAILMDVNLFAVAVDFLFDRDPKHTFVCFGTFGSIMMGAAAHAKIDSVVWMPEMGDVSNLVYRVNPTARTIVAVIDKMTEANYPAMRWPQISEALSMTPTSVSEIRCLIDDREVSGVRAMEAIEATQLVRVKSLARSIDAQ